MEEKRLVRIMIITVMILLIVDSGYRKIVQPQNTLDLLVVIGGVFLCALAILPKAEKSIQRRLLVLTITTLSLLVGDLAYRNIAQPRDLADLLVVIGGVVLCAWTLFPNLLKNMQVHGHMARGAVLGVAVVISGLLLYTGVTGNAVDWGKWLSSLLGVLTAFVLAWVVSNVLGWRKD